MLGFDVLELTDAAVTNGVASPSPTTLDLLRAPYGLAPDGVDLGVSRGRPGSLGGGGLYEEVSVALPLIVNGDCPADVYAAHQQLITLLEQAQRWRRDEGVPAVRLVAQATGSNVAPVSAAVLRLRDAEAAVVPPTVYEASHGGYAAQVTLQFLRRGTWLAAPEVKAAAAASTASEIITVTFNTAHRLASPLRAEVYSTPGNGWTNQAALALVSDQVQASGGVLRTATNGMRLINANSFTTPTTYSTQNESANLARGGTVLRHTPSAANTFVAASYTLPSAFLAQRTLVYGVCRNNAPATASYQVRWTYTPANGLSSTSQIVPLELPTNQPHAVYMGTLLSRQGIGALQLGISASAVGSSLDIDCILLVAADDATTDVLTYTTETLASSQYTVADAQPLTYPVPAFGIAGSGAGGAVTIPVTALGDAFAQTIGQRTAVCVLRPVQGLWRAGVNPGTAFLDDVTPTLTRWPAYLTLP